MSNLNGPFHQLFCIVNSGDNATDLFKPMGYRTLCINSSLDPRYKSSSTAGGGLDNLPAEGYTRCLKADGIFHLASHRDNYEEDKREELSQTQKSPRASCDLTNESGAYTVEICGVLEQIIHFPGKSVSMYILGSDKSPRSRFVQSRLLRWVSEWALKQQSWWATMNYSCTLLPSDSPPIELSRTESPVLRNQDIINSMSLARTNLTQLLQKSPEISRSLCNTVYTITLSNANKEAEIISEIIVVESHGWQTIDMRERDYQKALCVILELEPSHGFGLKPGEAQLLNRLRKATYRSTFVCLSAMENEVESMEEIKMFELGASLTNTAQQKRKVERLNTIIANQQAEIIQQGNNNKALERTNESLVKSTVEAREQRRIMEEQKRKFDGKRKELEVVINGLEAKTRCLEKPSPFVEMYKKSEKRRKEEVRELKKEIEQLRSISKDQEENISSLKEFNEVLREADAIEAGRKLRIWKQSYELGFDEMTKMVENKEKDYIQVIGQLGEAIQLFEERADRDKDTMKGLLHYSEQFKGDLEEANITIEQLDSDNQHLRLQVRSARKDLKNHSSYKNKIHSLKSDLKDGRAKFRESEKQIKDLEKKLLSIEKEIELKEKELEKRRLEVEKALEEAGKWKNEAAGERKTRVDIEKEMKSLEKKLKKTRMEMDTRKKSTDKERKAFEKQISSGMKDSSKLQILKKELEMQKKMLSDMTASKKEVVTILKEEKKHLQKENADLQKKLSSQQEKMLELQRLEASASALNLSRAEPDEKELATLKSKVVELKGREALFVSKVGKQKEKISKLKKENARLLAELKAGGVGKGDEEQIQKLTKNLKESEKLLKKNEDKRRKLKNELKITKDMFSEMEKEYKTLKKENKVMSKELDQLRRGKPKQGLDLHHDRVEDRAGEVTPKSGRPNPGHEQAPPKNPNQNPGSPPAADGEPTPAISKEKSKRRLLHKRKRGLITASKTTGVSASSFFQGNVNIDNKIKLRKNKRRRKKT